MTSQPSTMPGVPLHRGPLGVSREQLDELERELDVYLAFWGRARESRFDELVGEERP